MKTFVKSLMLMAGLVAVPSLGVAQDFPSKQVSIVVPFTAGGGVDAIGRFVADGLSKSWKQTVVVENRPGAGSAIGSAHVAQAKADGYTLLFVSSTLTTNAAVQKNLPFDPQKDLQPVALVAKGDIIVATGSRVVMSTLDDLAREAKSRTIFYGTSGVGSYAHFGGELLNDVMGIDMEAVHYNGTAAATLDLAGGRIDVWINSLTGALPSIANGTAKPIAVMSDSRVKDLPNVPSVAEEGLPDAQVNLWWGVFAPAGTPEQVVTKIHADIGTLMNSSEATEFLTRQGAAHSEMSVEEFTSYISNEIKKWNELAKNHAIIVE